MSPRSKPQVEEIRQRSIQGILQAGLELFAHQGFHNTTIQQIAHRAGISKGLMYNYFPSKEELLKAILNQAVQTGDEVVQLMEDMNRDPENALITVLDQIFKIVSENPSYWKLIMSLSLQEDITSRFKDFFQGHETRNLELLESLLSRLNVVNPRLEAMLLAALLDGILLHHIHFGDRYPLSEMKTLVQKKIQALIPNSKNNLI